VRKLRGSRTHGWGVSGQHRDSGMRGGHGKAGWCKHKWTSFVKSSRNELNKGFTCPTTQSHKIINLSQLEELISKNNYSGEYVQKIKNTLYIDLFKLGYGKLLGNGKIETPVNVTISRYSKSAKRKLEEIGGSITSKSIKNRE
jgi:large subunit ribosomal protein L15